MQRYIRQALKGEFITVEGRGQKQIITVGRDTGTAQHPADS
jgi:hypothetical protein